MSYKQEIQPNLETLVWKIPVNSSSAMKWSNPPNSKQSIIQFQSERPINGIAKCYAPTDVEMSPPANDTDAIRTFNAIPPASTYKTHFQT